MSNSQFTTGARRQVHLRWRVRRLAASTAVLVALPMLILGGTAGTAAASYAGRVTNYTGTGISSPEAIAAGPDGALWFTNYGNNSIGRITTAGAVTNYTGTGINYADGIAAGPDGALWFTNLYGNTRSGGSPPPARSPTTPAPAHPEAIAAGPDGALWFTNLINNSIGRITTAGVVTNYTGTGISAPEGIAAGPDGALWFTNWGNGSIGRITTAGAVTNYTGTRHQPARSRIAAGPDGALWFTNNVQQVDRADHHRRGGHQLHRHRHQPGRRDRGRPRWSPLVHQLHQQARSGGSRPPGWSPTTPAPASTKPEGIAAGPDGALWFTNYGNNSIGRITTKATPHISGHSPRSGPVGTTVTIKGVNLSGATGVAFNGTPATIVSDTWGQIVTVVPAGATTGHLTVTTPAGTATSKNKFTVT